MVMIDFCMWQNLACGEYNELLHKDAAIMIIQVSTSTSGLASSQSPFKVAVTKFFLLDQGVLEAEESYVGGHTDSSEP